MQLHDVKVLRHPVSVGRSLPRSVSMSDRRRRSSNRAPDNGLPCVESTVMCGEQDSAGTELKDMVTVSEIHPLATRKFDMNRSTFRTHR